MAAGKAGGRSLRQREHDATAKRFKVDKTTGKLTVPKGTKRGTYAVRVKVTAGGNGSYLAGSKPVSYKVRVK